MRKSKRILSVIVAVVMVACMFTMSFAASAKDAGNNFGDLVEMLAKHGVVIGDIHNMTDEEVEAMLDQLYWVYEDDPVGSVEMIVNCVKMFENLQDTNRHLEAGEDPVLYGKLHNYYAKWLRDHCAGLDYDEPDVSIPSNVTVPTLPTLPTKPATTKPAATDPVKTEVPETEAPDTTAKKPTVADMDTGDKTVMSAVAVLGLAGISMFVLSKKRKSN